MIQGSPFPDAPKIENTGPHGASPDNERLLAILCYGLFILAFANGLIALVGVVLAYLRRTPAVGTIYRSHYDNLITVFWSALIAGFLCLLFMLNMATAALLFMLWPVWRFHTLAWGLPASVASIPLILLAAVIFACWYLYRVLRGFLRALDEKPY